MIEINDLNGTLLIAAPTMQDPRFAGTVIVLCNHDANGIMGLIVNRLMGTMKMGDVIKQLDIESPLLSAATRDIAVHYGGPVAPDRGFLLHTDAYRHEKSAQITDQLFLAANTESMVDLLGTDRSPFLFALGFALWMPGQLEDELASGAWLQAPLIPSFLFGSDMALMWRRALQTIGIDPVLLSGDAGHA